MRFRLGLVLLAGGLVLCALMGAAAAALPIKGATYKGTLAGEPLQFKVSANGKKVSGFSVAFAPIGCQGVGPSVASGGSSKISTKSTFKVSLTIYFPPTQPSRHVGTLVVTGKFGKHGKESGTAKSQFTGNGFTSACNTTKSYSTKG